MMSRDPCGKALVFSQFTSMLALIEHRLMQVWSWLVWRVEQEEGRT